MKFIATQNMIEDEASEIFQPFIKYKDKAKETNFYTYYSNLNEIRFYYTVKNTTIKTYSEILVGNSKNDLLKKIRSIKKYVEDKKTGNNKVL